MTHRPRFELLTDRGEIILHGLGEVHRDDNLVGGLPLLSNNTDNGHSCERRDEESERTIKMLTAVGSTVDVFKITFDC